MTVRPESRPLLSLATDAPEGYRHGNRTLRTCMFKCGMACDHPEPNTTDHPTIQDEIGRAISRRSVLGGAAVGAGALVVTVGAGSLSAAAAGPTVGTAATTAGPLAKAAFTPVAPNRRDAVVTPRGWTHNVIISWGDAVLPGAPEFDPYNLTEEGLKKQFGYNNDYVGVMPLPGSKAKALMYVNHEYDDALTFPSGHYDAATLARLQMLAHGISVVTIKKGKVPGEWLQVKPSATGTPMNRRIHIDTPFKLTGPAAGHDFLKTSADTTGTTVLGTLNSCSGGRTPWGTFLSGEENIDQYFGTDGTMPTGPTLADGTVLTNAYSRYTIAAAPSGDRKWRQVDPRFDLAAEPNEPHRFGWIVEVDPTNPTKAPIKHTMLGRFKHEGANVTVAGGRAVVYSGDDNKGDYIYKFVSKNKIDTSGTAAAKKANLKLLDSGTLYVGKFTGSDTGAPTAPYEGTVEWIPLCSDTESFVDGMTVEEVLVFTRIAADKVGPTKMDRPEDVEVNPVNKKLYVALTNNDKRGTDYPVDEANPVNGAGTRVSPVDPLVTKTGNRNGYILEITPGQGDHLKPTATFDLLLVCGDPESPETYFAGFDKTKVSRISCPDNVTFDSVGNLWIATDGAPSTLGQNDGLHRVPVDGPNRGQVQCFLTVPKGAETCGPLVYDDDRSLFFAPQHPGEMTGSTFETPASTWPHTNDYPRPSVCVAYKQA